jgi:hypothetical protein
MVLISCVIVVPVLGYASVGVSCALLLSLDHYVYVLTMVMHTGSLGRSLR